MEGVSDAVFGVVFLADGAWGGVWVLLHGGLSLDNGEVSDVWSIV